MAEIDKKDEILNNLASIMMIHHFDLNPTIIYIDTLSARIESLESDVAELVEALQHSRCSDKNCDNEGTTCHPELDQYKSCPCLKCLEREKLIVKYKADSNG